MPPVEQGPHSLQLCSCHPWNKALIPCSYAHATRGTRPSFQELYFCCLGKHRKTETSLKTNFLLIKGICHFLLCCFDVQISENIMASEWNIGFLKHRTHFSWKMTASIKLMTQMTNGCLTLNKLGRRRMKLCQRMMATLQCQNVSTFIRFFPAPTQFCSS